VTLADAWTGDEKTLEEIDLVVMATGYFPNNALHKSLIGR
jgi:lysine/ornithine N-monooxygenase